MVITLLGISCLIMVDSLHRRWVARAGGQLVMGVTYPVQKASESANDGTRNILSLVPDFFRTRAQNDALRGRVSELEQQIISLRENILRERRLADLERFHYGVEGEKLVARVIGADPTAWFSTVIIDKGSSDGIERFMPAVSAAGLAGCVIEVYRYSSKIILLTDSNSKVSVVTQRSRARGVVQGNKIRGCILKYVEATADIAEGDVLITSGNSRIYPEGLVVGRIEELRKRPGDLFQSAVVVPETDFARLEEVSVIVMSKLAEAGGGVIEP